MILVLAVTLLLLTETKCFFNCRYVGRQVNVWWSGDQVWYTAEVLEIEPHSGDVSLQYLDDALRQTITLYREKCAPP